MAPQLSNLLDLLKYNPAEPLLFTSGLFLFLFLGFTCFYGFMRRAVTLRIVYVTLFSLYFYYKTSGIFFLLLMFTATSDFFIGHFIATSRRRGSRRAWVALSVCINLGMLGYFKYTNFLIDIVNNFLADPLEFQNIFLPIGISFFTFQSMSYIIDLYRGKVRPLHRWIDYLFYISFFPQLVAGPIVRARDFIPQIHQRPLTVSRAQFGEGVWLILCGLFKKAVISDFISLNFVDRIFDNPMLYTGLENLMGVLGYAMQIYCDFSGYSDMAIGIALLLGFRFNANFNSPYKSATITEFWRRWHISLSTWLKDYLYISLGGNRKGRLRTYANLMITMLLGGLWHGAAMRFVMWGGLHGAGLAGHKLTMHLAPGFRPTGADMPRWRRVIGILLTFSFVCATWVFFRAESMEVAGQIFSQIFTAFHPEIFWDFVAGYKWVLLLMGIGYVLHFTSDRLEQRTLQAVQRLPIVVYALMTTGLIWLIAQLSSGDIQPFIYFQF
ncbi:MBOAT family protein [uncultured Rikenella sp.]|uniref:MBOAT family O-acyltransferase n=1 Tax=uncultured Rikenella sp. TaxID=368003 RepID=UPI00272A8C62|nr:MBOAT family O-acyltransferase [uncultured Rikenella sp.]